MSISHEFGLSAGATVTADEIRSYVKARVAPYKYPRMIWIVDSLPKGSPGKIVKREKCLRVICKNPKHKQRQG